jgi:ABC-type Fe3+/spermidine/putrescine transport system ATPase subunit
MPFLVLDRLDKRFGDLTVLDSVSLDVAEGEVLALLGPSGSGKTTLLRLLAGFEAPDGGRIVVAGQDVAPLPPARRRFGMVFQHYALFPHLTVGENVAFGLEGGGPGGHKLERAEVGHRVTEALALVDLGGFETRRPGEISGGQQQRVALARALATEPRLLLLDEPLSNLDPALRERTRRELAAAVRRVGITTVLVTHEQEEAFELGDRVAVLHRGRLDQVGIPEELYERPATRFVATFVGRAAVLPGTAVESRRDGESDVEVAASGVRWRAASVAAEAAGAAGARVDLVVRPEALAFVAAGAEGALPGRVAGRRYAGPVTLYRVELEVGHDVEVAVAERGIAAGGTAAAAAGDRVHVAPRPEGPAPRAFPTPGRPGEDAR